MEPETNGMAEQVLRIIFKMVQIMLVKAKMLHDWWAEACDYVIKAGNLLPSSRHLGKVPEEGWTGKQQTVRHLHVWGSTCYVKIPAAKGHSKLSPWGQKGWLIGLAEHRSYQIVLDDICGNQIIVSHDVIFEELAPTCTVSSSKGEITYEDINQPLKETTPEYPPAAKPCPSRIPVPQAMTTL